MTDQKKWKKEEIQAKLASDDAWLIRGLLAIFKRQTEEEKANDTTKEENGIGFNAFDAPIMSDMAKQYNDWGRLTKRQLVIVRKVMHKYAGQLAKIANGQA